MLFTPPKPPLTYFSFLRMRAGLVQRLGDARVVEGDLVVDPLVVDLGRGHAQHHVLDPVGHRPAGGVTGLDADAPGLGAVGGDGVAELQQLVPGLRDLPALLGEHRRRVPDEGLHVGAERRAVEGAVDRSVAQPVGGVVGLGHRLGVGGDRLGLAGSGEALDQAGLRDEGDVGSVATVDPHWQLRLELAAAFVLDVDAGALLEFFPGLLQPLVLDLPDGGVDLDTRSVVSLVLLVRAAVGRRFSAAVVSAARGGAQHQPHGGGDRQGRSSAGESHGVCSFRTAPRVDQSAAPIAMCVTTCKPVRQERSIPGGNKLVTIPADDCHNARIEACRRRRLSC